MAVKSFGAITQYGRWPTHSSSYRFLSPRMKGMGRRDDRYAIFIVFSANNSMPTSAGRSSASELSE